MANPRYNQQVTNRRGAMNGGRMKKMGGGMMKRKMLNSGTKPDFLDIDKDKNFKESFKSAAKSIKKTSGGMRANKKEKAGMKSGVGKLNKGLRKFLAKKGSK